MAQQRASASHPVRSCCQASPPTSERLISAPSVQRNLGNRALSQLLQSRKIQAKLIVGPEDDAYEREADRIGEMVEKPARANAVSRVSHATVQKKCVECESESAQRGVRPVALEEEETGAGASDQRINTKRQSNSTHETGYIEQALKAGSQNGRPLESSLRTKMEQRIGADFSAVKVHTNAAAAQMTRELNALAFTHGSDIYFGEGKYDPSSPSGQRLLAHELAHVVQQDGSAQSKLIQRNGKPKPATVREYKTFQVLVPKDYTTLDQMYRLFERTAYGRETNFTNWRCNDFCDMSKNAGKVIRFNIPKKEIEQFTDPDLRGAKEKSKESYDKLQGTTQQAVKKEVDKRYYEQSGDKPGTQIKKTEEGKAQMWEDKLHEVIKEKEILENLPAEVKGLLGPETAYKPADYQRLLKIAEKLKQFSTEDLAVYKLLTVRATSDIELFEKSVDMFLARKEELKKALDAQQPKTAGDKKSTLQESFDEKWKGLDEASIGKMSESDRYDLARQKTAELTEAQIQYMKEHPGETLKDFAKSATLVNTPETFSAIGKDIQEAADGDANSWARWAAGTGAGAKLSGWLLAVAGVLFVASWLTGIGELATIAAAAAILLGSTLTLSLAESELRIKAASEAKTPEEFKRNVELAAAARTNVIMGVALLVVALVLHFTAKALFPQTIKKISTSLKNFRERIRLKGSIYELKPQIKTDMGAYKAELLKGAEAAKKSATTYADELGKLSTEQFVEKLESGDAGLLDQSKLPPDQKINYRELLKTPEGRKAIEGYKARLINSLKTDVIQAIDNLAKEYISKIDEFLKDVEAAKNHDELKAATDKFESATSEESMKKFVAGEQEKLQQQKLEEAAQEAHLEIVTSIKEAMLKRLKERFGKQADKFKLDYTDAEITDIVKKGKELGLSDKVIEDFIYTGSRTAKAISAADLMKQMENWVTEISKRGFPYKFTDLAQFEAFSKHLLDSVRAAKLPTDDVRIQGSSLRKPGADDVDIAVFVDETAFDKILIDRYNERMAFADGRKISIAGKSHKELVKLGQDIEANPANYNNQARTFMNAIKSGIVNSKSDILPALKSVKKFLADKYPNLNLQTISVLIRGGLFEVKPDLKVTSK